MHMEKTCRPIARHTRVSYLGKGGVQIYITGLGACVVVQA